MGIFSRLADIVNSNISALLDKAEDPQKLIRLIIQEMEEQLVQERSNLARYLANRKSLERQIATYLEQIEKWQGKAELALMRERDDLAKAALLEKARQQAIWQQLSDELLLVNESIAQLTHAIDILQEKLKEARSRQKSLVLRHQSVDSRIRVQKQVERGSSQKILDKFEQMEQRIERMEAEAESYTVGTTPLEREFAELEVDDKVQSELEELKRKLHGEKP